MLKRLSVRNFKSLRQVEVKLPRFSVLFGPNAAGKSNLVEAIRVLSFIGTQRTLADAFAGSIRGYALEAFAMPPGGIADLVATETASCALEADLAVPTRNGGADTAYQYKIEVEINTRSGALANRHEFLSALSVSGEPKGRPAIQPEGGRALIRRQTGGGRPREEQLGQGYAVLSDRRFVAPAHRTIDAVRTELQDWRAYYFSPAAMRTATPPHSVPDIGIAGEFLGPFLYRLKSEHPRRFDAVARALRSIVPSIEAVDISLDTNRGILDLWIRQDGVFYSSRVVSEGTLRVLSLCTLAVNPWSSSLLAFEEPENGVHPRRIELVARMLTSLALDENRQVVVTTHSPLFCGAVLREARSRSTNDVGLFSVRRSGHQTDVRAFDPGPLFADRLISESLSESGEDALFENLVLRGLIDE